MTGRIVIIGAGISGILAARTLQSHGNEVRILEKSRGTGGRMATRRLGELRFDHGAQFFTIRHTAFASIVEPLLTDGIAREWCHGFLDTDRNPNTDGHPRYCGTEGMSRIVRHLSSGLDLHFQTRVASIRSAESEWILETEQGETILADAIISSAPVPQTLAFFKDHQSDLHAGLHPVIGHLTYERCHALMIETEGPSPLPTPGGIQLHRPPLAWIADNHQKGLNTNPDSATLTVHSTPEFAEAYWDRPLNESEQALKEAVTAEFPIKIRQSTFHRWGFSKPHVQFPERCYGLKQPHPIVFCGDAFGEPRVEGAALSGLAAADWLAAC